MAELDWLAQQFEAQRIHLRAVAYRMLGSHSEADDAVQEAWVRLSQSDTSGVGNLAGWLTTVVARLCLDALRTRKSRREEPVEAAAATEPAETRDAAHEILLGESIGAALLVVLDALTPAERVAFVLHDMFDLSFEEIAPIVDRSPAAARQLASRARRRVQGAPSAGESDVARRRAVVDAFLAASRDGNFEALLAVLAPEVVLRADDTAVTVAAANQGRGAPALAPEIRGARAVADTFKGRARGALPALIDGAPGAVWVQGGQPRGAFVFTVDGARIVAIELVMDPLALGELDIEW